MPFKHIFGLPGGMRTNAPAGGIYPFESPYMYGCAVKDGEVVSDYGLSKFPVPTDTRTNQLHGTPLLIDQHYKFDGLSWLLCFTTTNVYKFNETTQTWDNVTKGVEVSDCENIWSTPDHVTSVTDEDIKLRGSKSVKITIANEFATGIAAYRDFTDKDFSSYTGIHLWIRVNKALVANEMAVRLSNELGGGVGDAYVDINLPAVSADVWTPVCVSADLSTLNAALSVALIVNADEGAVVVYLDDIKAVEPFTGDEDNLFSGDILNDYYIVTNGVDHPQKWAGGENNFVDLDTSLAAGDVSSSEFVLTFKDRVILLNNIENGAEAPQRVTWSSVGTLETFIGGTSGYQDLTDDISWIIGAGVIGENEAVIYKERSVVLMQWVGGQTPFRFQTLIVGTGSLSKRTIDSGAGEHNILGPDLIYAYRGGTSIDILDDKIKKTLYGELDRGYAHRSFLLYVEEDDELWLFVPTQSETPDKFWVYHIPTEVWYVRDKALTCVGFYKLQSALTIGDLTGTIGEQNWRFGDALSKAYAPIQLGGKADRCVYKLDKMKLDNDTSPVISEYQTPDFTLPDSEFYINKHMRVSQLLYEASGQSITTEYSTDGGLSWKPTMGANKHIQALDSVVRDYQQDFDVVCKKVRFKFRNESLGSGFKLVYFGFRWEVRSGRL